MSQYRQNEAASPSQREAASETMNEDQPFLRITEEDIAEANQLSLRCPICAGAVEKHTADPDLLPVYCTECETLYHRGCWEQGGGKCAVLGCEGAGYRRYGAIDLGPSLTIDRGDIDRASRRLPTPNGQTTKKLKLDEQRRQRQGGFWSRLWQSLLNAIKLWPSDQS